MTTRDGNHAVALVGFSVIGHRADAAPRGERLTSAAPLRAAIADTLAAIDAKCQAAPPRADALTWAIRGAALTLALLLGMWIGDLL